MQANNLGPIANAVYKMNYDSTVNFSVDGPFWDIPEPLEYEDGTKMPNKAVFDEWTFNEQEKTFNCVNNNAKPDKSGVTKLEHTFTFNDDFSKII